MSTQFLAFVFLFISVQFGCTPVAETEKVAAIDQKPKPFTLAVEPAAASPSDMRIDLRNFSQIRDVELTDNGLFMLTNFSKAGSFALFREGAGEWDKLGTKQFESGGDADRAAIKCVDFVDGINGWAIGYEMDVWHTDDAGSSWEHLGKIPERSPAAKCEVLQFTSLQTGWMADLNGLFRTMDGGKNWTRVNDISIDAGNLTFLDRSIGWVTAVDEDNNSTIYTTSDGGVSWTSYKTAKTRIDEIRPLNSLTGIAGGRWGPASITTDAGRTFNSIDALPGKFRVGSIDCLGEICFIAGYQYSDVSAAGPRRGHAVVYKTADNGRTVATVDLDTDEPFFSMIKFFNNQIGVLAGRDALFKTIDGGQSWVEILRIPANTEN